jgi:hypothetical protein
MPDSVNICMEGGWVLETFDGNTATMTVQTRSATFHECRDMLLNCFHKKKFLDPTFIVTQCPDRVASVLLSIQNHLRIRMRRHWIERFGGERRRKAFAKSKSTLQCVLLVEKGGNTQLSIPSLVVPSWAEDFGGSDETKLRCAIERLGGLHRRTRFMNATHQMKLFFLGKVQRERPRMERSLSIHGRCSPTSVLLRQGLDTAQSFLEKLDSKFDTTNYPPSISADRRQFLKHRLKVERYSGESRRNFFRRTKNAVSPKLERLLLMHLSAKLDFTQYDTSVESELALRIDCKSYFCNPKSRQKTNESLVDWQHQRLSEVSRDISWGQGPFVAWSPRSTRQHSIKRKTVSKNMLLNIGFQTFDDLNQFW